MIMLILISYSMFTFIYNYESGVAIVHSATNNCTSGGIVHRPRLSDRSIKLGFIKSNKYVNTLRDIL